MRITIDEQLPDLIWWHYDPVVGWTGFNTELEQMQRLAREQKAPVVVIFAPEADMPAGNPIPHIQRLMKVMSSEENLYRFIAIIPPHMRIAQAFAQITLKALRIDYHVDFCASEDEALKQYEQLMQEKNSR